MGVLNVTPDSFYSGSRAQTRTDIANRARQLVADGADMLDIGAYSSRPGADDVSADEELRRLEAGLSAVREAVGDSIPVSVDTFRADVARRAVEWGADIINDISGGLLDEDMFETIADLHVPYILMHMRGTPATMQTMTDYTDVVADVIGELSHKLSRLEELGVADVIIDPGFGFAKTLDQNYRLLSQLDSFAILRRPVLAGMVAQVDVDTASRHRCHRGAGADGYREAPWPLSAEPPYCAYTTHARPPRESPL